ncbi:MAG TPA: glycogen debranching N-terminal domain-containing protein [Ktedonobacterales bacterium]
MATTTHHHTHHKQQQDDEDKRATRSHGDHKDDKSDGKGRHSGHLPAGSSSSSHSSSVATHHRGHQTGEQETEQPKKKNQLATTIGDISSAVTTKYNQVFMLTDTGGNFTPQDAGYGLYFRDTQFLNHWELQICGQHAISLLSDSSRGMEARIEQTNPTITLSPDVTIDKESLSIQRIQTLHHQCTDDITIRNMRQTPIAFDLKLLYGSNFTNMFQVRGHKPGERGTLNPPQVKGKSVYLSYQGADGHLRSVTITFSEPPDALDGSSATYHLKLKARASQELKFTLALADEGPHEDHRTATAYSPKSATDKHATFDQALQDMPTIEVNNALFERALRRSLADIRMLASSSGDDIYVSAGVPWYVALFGRDSCISAYEVLAFQPHLARTTLEVLARYQGTKDNAFQDEQPGKILHELRVGEMANLHEVPMIPYYGTVDSTPWFLMLLGAYVRWTGDVELYHKLKKNVDRALGWIDHNLATGLKGFLTYGSQSEKGLLNQGWKDSDDAIVNADGTLCQPPIALVEAQGYVYDAWLQVAYLKRATGDEKGAKELEKKAAKLRQSFNEHYWIPKRDYYGLCIERNHQLSGAIASNPGQTLFTGISDEDKRASLVKMLMTDDMFNGWGIRTLSAAERAYNPLDYQVGSVWPHDNALIALGLRRAGFAEEMERVFTGIFDAATLFPQFRLPEVFDGFSRNEYDKPVNYPVACSPQAWAAGALPLLLTAALGLEPSALERRLIIHRPRLPQWMTSVSVQGLRVADAKVDLRYERRDDTTLVAVKEREGTLEVEVQY